MTGSIQKVERKIITEWLPTLGYEYADASDIEVYLDTDSIDGKFEVWLPLKEKIR
ncbi:MAG: GyrI-like domain-containing protein [Niameybacter sp.]